MSVYIKGMEMPASCFDTVLLCNDGRVFMYKNGGWVKSGTAVHVPPHGRLIEEADSIETAWMILRGLGYFKEENPQLEQTVREGFATAPAIEVE